MKVQVSLRNMSGIAGGGRGARVAVSEALRRFKDHIQWVRVVISDENGPRGGRDKRCKLVIARRRRRPVVVTHTGTTTREAIMDCTRTALHALGQKKRRRDAGSRTLSEAV